MDTTVQVVGVGDDPGQTIRSRRVLSAITTTALAVLMLISVADGVDLFDAWGVDDARSRASGGGYELTVRHPRVTRAALASPFDIEIRRDGGFDGPVTVAVDRDYLRLWDINYIHPTPAAEIGEGEWVHWQFDPPGGDVLKVSLDARIEPAVQSGTTGRVAVLDGGVPVVEVTLPTRVMP